MLSDAKLYSEHRSLQSTDSEVFFESVVKKMDWSREEQDVVMDIGCGTGNFCRKTLLPNYPRVRKIIGVDVLPEMIEFAKKDNRHKKIEYHLVDIEDRGSTQKWSQELTKVVSIYCFNWLEDQEKAFRNIYDMLKSGGEAGVIFVLSTPFWESYEVHYKNPKWSKYLENCNPRVPESHFKKYGASYYRNLLQDIGFIVIRCEDAKRVHAYSDDDDCRDAIFATALTNYIPEDLKPEFREDVFQSFLKYNDRNPDGKATLHYSSLTLHVRKPAA